MDSPATYALASNDAATVKKRLADRARTGLEHAREGLEHAREGLDHARAGLSEAAERARAGIADATDKARENLAARQKERQDEESPDVEGTPGTAQTQDGEETGGRAPGA